MKVVLNVQLQQDNGTAVLTGTQTAASFTGQDIDTVRGFLSSIQMQSFVRLMGWVADGIVAMSGTPTVTISTLK